MRKYLAYVIALPQWSVAEDRWRRLPGEILLLTAFVLTASWLTKG